MNTNVYPELFDQVVRADAPFRYDHNEIVELAYGTYQDYYPKSQLYLFEESFRRERRDVIFEPGDMYEFILRKIKKWSQAPENRNNLLIRSYEDVVHHGYAMMIVEDEKYPKIIPVQFKLGSSDQKPYQLMSRLVYEEAYSSDLSELAKLVYFFNEEDIERLASDFEVHTRP